MTSKIKVDNINKVSDDSNIINKCGTTVTVGAASDGVRTGADNLQAAHIQTHPTPVSYTHLTLPTKA